jgi:hypothetical protein
MTTQIRKIAVLLALGVSPAASGMAVAAGEAPGVYVNRDRIAGIEFGLACTLDVSGVEDAPDTDLGQINIIASDPEFSTHTGIVPDTMGVNFGVMAKSVGQDIDGVLFRLTHPPFFMSGSKTELWGGNIGVDAYSYDFFSFEFPRELVTGPWVFEAYKDDVLLYRVPFDVVDARKVPWVAGLCSGEALTS